MMTAYYPSAEGGLAAVGADGPRAIQRLAVVRVDGRSRRPRQPLELPRCSNYQQENEVCIEVCKGEQVD